MKGRKNKLEWLPCQGIAKIGGKDYALVEIPTRKIKKKVKK